MWLPRELGASCLLDRKLHSEANLEAKCNLVLRDFDIIFECTF